MKKLKKLGSMFLALAMALALAIPAMAAGDFVEQKEYKITLPATAGQTARTYKVYQIFTGDLASKDGEFYLSNVEWGASGKPSEEGETASDAAAKLDTLPSDTTATENAIAKYVDLEKAVAEVTTGEQDVVVTVNSVGYYLFRDITANLGDGEALSTYVVKVVGNVEVTPKTGTTSFEKKVQDINDSTDTDYGEWQDSADYDIGDEVPFQLTVTLPANADAYETYKLIFHDTLSTGLTFEDTSVATVYINGRETGKTLSATKDGQSLTFTIDDVKTLVDQDKLSELGVTSWNNATVALEYKATLNTSAVIGSEGNENDAYVDFSNNPHGTGTGTTPHDTAIVFTYKVDINKVDENEEALAGAAFKLEKKIKDTNQPNGYSLKLIKEFTAGPDTTFTFEGLDDGDYVLTETATPTGYNSIDPIEFSIVATHTNGKEPELEALKVVKSDDHVTVINSFTVQHTTDNKPSGSISSDVKNSKGVTLPETGGMGTTIFYAVGGVLVLGAVVFLVTKKRVGE